MRYAGASEADTAAFWKLSEFFTPTGRFHNAANAFGKIYGAEPKEIRSVRVRRLHDAQPQIGRIDLQLFRDFIELHFLAKARLHGTVSALRSTWRFIRERAAALESIARYMVSRGLQRASVKRAGHAVRAVRATIDQRLQMHGGDGAVFFHAGFEIHQDRVAAAMAVKNFFARQADFYRAVKKERGFGHHDFVIERIALASEAAAIRSRDDANMRGRHLQDFGERAMQVVRGLGAGPNGEFAVGIFSRHRGVLLDGEMRAALVEKSVFEDFVFFGETLVDIAEFQGNTLVDVAFIAVLVNTR